jgi:hypothetical protein
LNAIGRYETEPPIRIDAPESRQRAASYPKAATRPFRAARMLLPAFRPSTFLRESIMITTPVRKPVRRMSEAERKQATEKAVAEHVAKIDFVEMAKRIGLAAPADIQTIKDPVRLRRMAKEINSNNGDVFLDVKRVSIGLCGVAKVILIEEADGVGRLLTLPIKLSKTSQ